MDLLNQIGRITGLYEEEIQLSESFIDFASRFSGEPGTVCLMSGGELDCAQYHMLALKPFLLFSGKNRSIHIRSEKGAFQIEADPFDILRSVINHFGKSDIKFPKPVSAGLFGYLSYDLKDAVEHLPRTSVDDLGLPSIWFMAPSILVIQDKHSGRTVLYMPECEHELPDNRTKQLAWFRDVMNNKPWTDPGFSGDGNGLRSNFDKPTYMENIAKIREYIAAGDIYQVNMSQRFTMGFKGNPFSLFKALYSKNPAPFFAYINEGDHHIVSTSPERFILRRDRFVETRPIKGTRPRCKNPDDDMRMKKELSESRKDDAELSMIVDLMRNDIGKVCKGGSVHVTEHKRVEAYTNVYHLISIVHGELDQGMDDVDLIRATFPGGSITGCPKIRSMEIIDELETNRRHIYTGSIGYIGFHGTMDLSIAIRTATISKGRLVFSVGGGVVYDSDPEDEYNETLHKGRTLFDTFSGNQGAMDQPLYGWMNGALKPLDTLTVPVTDPGFQYGHGFFETIRVDHGKIRFLDEHLNRISGSWKHYFRKDFPDLSFDVIIDHVIRACGLENSVAAVKIIVTAGNGETQSILVLARPYTHRLDVLNKSGISLVTCGSPRLSPLADHKSMNYQYYYLEGQRAHDLGGDESLILNPDGSVSETNTANIFFIKDRTAVYPASEFRLKGIMEEQVGRLLESWGYTIETRKIYPGEFSDFDLVFLTNSLMGAVPVLALDEEPLPDASDICREINRVLL